MPYDPEKPIPPGYKVEERVRKGAVIAGAIVMGVPYAIGVNVAAASGFENKSYWLLIPGIGPFLTLSTRDDACDDRNDTGEEAADCLGDIFLTMLLGEVTNNRLRALPSRRLKGKLWWAFTERNVGAAGGT